MNKESVKLGLILGAISLVIAVLLSVVNTATKDVIAARQEQEVQTALAKVIPDAVFTKVEADIEIYEAKQGEETVGYCVKTLPQGYGGEITLIVGVGTDGTVKGVSITAMDETPGLGALAKEEEFLNKFIGKSGTLAVTKDGGEIEALSGATVTSRAVTEGVNEAILAVKNITGGN